MSEYRAPLEDMRFVLRELAGMAGWSSYSACAEFSPELGDAVLDEASRFAAEVLSPLNEVGDREGSRLEAGRVVTATGFRDAYARLVESGWVGLECDPKWGGQGLPKALGAAVNEMWSAANHAFSMSFGLNQGAIRALSLAGSEDLQRLYLPRLVSGEWSGTMNLTEPQAGSDLAAIRARAVPQPDGSYRLSGNKIFISFGEHDMSANIVHLVLARIDGAPAGTRGLSLFLAPKFLPDAEGRPGVANDVRCIAVEHKTGIRGKIGRAHV